jgi:hypothetical protein
VKACFLSFVFFKKKFDSEVKDKVAKVSVEPSFLPLFEALKKKFEEILGLKLDLAKLEKA